MMAVMMVGWLALWIYAFRRHRSATAFAGRWRWVWLAILIPAPVLGLILFLSALRNVERLSPPQPGRLERLLKRGHCS